jgi:hypothetical protein
LPLSPSQLKAGVESAARFHETDPAANALSDHPDDGQPEAASSEPECPPRRRYLELPHERFEQLGGGIQIDSCARIFDPKLSFSASSLRADSDELSVTI